MSTPQPTNPFERFLQTMEKFPPSPGLVFHGLPAGATASAAGTLRGIVATSRNPRVATENFTTPVVACIVTRTGRDIGPLSAHPAEEETVLLPGIVLLPVMSGRHDALGIDFVVWEELNLDAEAVDADRDAASAALQLEITERLTAAWNAEPITIGSPGKFTAPLPF
ncbi:hypothetical protein GCM10027056_27860 [Glaciibacter psychrotolerans]